MAVPIHDTVCTITPDDAKRILLHDTHAYFMEDPSPSEVKVELYVKLMENYLWKRGSELHFFQFDNDFTAHLVNGRHRMHAVIKSKTVQDFHCYISKIKHISLESFTRQVKEILSSKPKMECNDLILRLIQRYRDGREIRLDERGIAFAKILEAPFYSKEIPQQILTVVNYAGRM